MARQSRGTQAAQLNCDAIGSATSIGMCPWLRRHREKITILGLMAIGVGVLLHLGDLLGWLKYPERASFVTWVLTSDQGVPLNEPSAQAFMASFPPPPDEDPTQLTHVTKSVLRHELGGVIQDASINYLRQDGTRTAYVANLYDVQQWASESPYSWWAWCITLLGFLAELLSYLIGRCERRAASQAAAADPPPLRPIDTVVGLGDEPGWHHAAGQRAGS